MNEFLCRKFIKKSDMTTDPAVRESYGKFAGIIGILSNVLLCTAKILVGAISGSIAIIADGVNNLTDASSSVITLAGFKLASMPEDEEHPYGHGRIEYIAGMIVSVMIVVVGIELLKTSFGKILDPSPVEFSIPVVIVLVAAIFIKVWQSRFYIFVGRKIKSLTLEATGTDSRNDVIATSAVLISLLVGKFSGVQIDGYMGCAVAAFIIWSGITLVKETISPLLGEAPDPEMVNSICEMATSYDGVLGIHDLVVHNYGPGRVFASLHVEVDSAQNLLESHDIIDNMEKDIQRKLHIHITGHLDPVKVNDPLVNQMKEVTKNVVSEMDGVSDIHDLRVIPGPTHTNIVFDVVLAPTCKLSLSEIHMTFQDAARAIDPKYNIVINYDKSYIHRTDQNDQ